MPVTSSPLNGKNRKKQKKKGGRTQSCFLSTNIYSFIFAVEDLRGNLLKVFFLFHQRSCNMRRKEEKAKENKTKKLWEEN